MAFAIFTPSLLHWRVGTGAPATVTANETLLPGSTVCDEGWTVIDGLIDNAGVVILAIFEYSLVLDAS